MQGHGTENIPVYSLAKLSPGSLNPLGVWTRFREWLREWGDVMALVCITRKSGTEVIPKEKETGL